MSTGTCTDRDSAAQWLARLCATPPATPPTLPGEALVLYGAGKLGHLAAELFNTLGRALAFCIDRQPPPSGCLKTGLPVRHPDEVPMDERARRPVAVCVVTSPYEPIRDALAKAGWTHIVPVYDLLQAGGPDGVMNNGWFSGVLTPEDQHGIARVLDGWHDDLSRAAHLQSLAWRVQRAEWSFEHAPVTIDDRYFIPDILDALQPGETLIDGGAWHGEFLDNWLQRDVPSFTRATAIEPDPQNHRALSAWRDALAPDDRERIRLVACALSDTDGQAAFSAGAGMASRLKSTGSQQVGTCRIDSLALSPTFIKLHLEGHELPALKGAVDTLHRCRPVLALTTYHNRDGLWRTPAWLMDTLPDYRFFMRMHGWCGTGAVVYGIPAERMRR
ncbi:FkbM family methyltransferase [Nitrogeniibacter aestuarii]|uniref:FkbM family methyltransferase n=1 Tax=Nitrogeniibacter aestuarii TaxID=2815343 RepID=UPI001D125C62|nr:FkbM family methyltransferase [Nitrogeniibacter aestuarii]